MNQEIKTEHETCDACNLRYSCYGDEGYKDYKKQCLGALTEEKKIEEFIIKKQTLRTLYTPDINRIGNRGNKIIGMVVGFVIALIIIAFILPVGFDSVYNLPVITGTGMDSAIMVMIQTMIPVVAVLGIVLILFQIIVRRR